MDTKAWQYEAIRDLRGYVAANGGAAQEERLLAEVGDWLGDNALGTQFQTAIGKGSAIVTVDIPKSAQAVAMLPIEVARLGQRTLHDHRVTLVSAVAEDGQAAGDNGNIGDCLHVLAVFPAPPGVPSLNQQRARRAMGQSFTELGYQGKAVAFRPVQYDVTAEKVNDALVVNPGFDIVHICGYGIPGLLRVPRRKPGALHSDIAGLLEINYGRVKLVTISPCVATATAPAPMTSEWMAEGTSWAVDLARRLDCAVLTFRFPIPDEFACDYFREFYRLLVASGQPVASAAALALSEVRDSGDTEDYAKARISRHRGLT